MIKRFTSGWSCSRSIEADAIMAARIDLGNLAGNPAAPLVAAAVHIHVPAGHDAGTSSSPDC